MKFHCPGCRANFTVPDEKIPEGKELRILCPKCRTPIESEDVLKAKEAAKQATKSGSLPAVGLEDALEEASALEIVEEGVKTSLLCISDAARAQKIGDVLRQLDFFVSPAPSAKFAIYKLHQNPYDLVVLDETFDVTQDGESLFLHHISLLPMHVRRQFYLCFLSETLPTLDQLVAFRMGVNMILNTRDLDRAKLILTRALKEHKSFYKVFHEALEKKGQL